MKRSLRAPYKHAPGTPQARNLQGHKKSHAGIEQDCPAAETSVKHVVRAGDEKVLEAADHEPNREPNNQDEGPDPLQPRPQQSHSYERERAGIGTDAHRTRRRQCGIELSSQKEVQDRDREVRQGDDRDKGFHLRSPLAFAPAPSRSFARFEEFDSFMICFLSFYASLYDVYKKRDIIVNSASNRLRSQEAGREFTFLFPMRYQLIIPS